MKPQITKAFFPSGQFKNRKGKKKKQQKQTNTSFRMKRKGCGRARLWGCPPSGPTATFVQRTVRQTPRPTDCVLGMGEGPGHLCAQTKGQRCGQLHLCPPPWLRASCAPTEVPEVALTHAGAQNTSFCLNCGQAL